VRKKRKAKAARQSTDALAARAQSHLQGGRFREAVDAYKQLLKREQRSQWREALAEAYFGRSKQLAGKGMYQEAAALWENMANLCGDRHLDQYIHWLLQGGRLGRGARRFADAEAAFRESQAGHRIAAHLAGLILCGHDEIAEVLPPESPILQQRAGVHAALQAYCDGDDEAMRQRLSAIPFRSPYRDLRMILQALVGLDKDQQPALTQLQRVAGDSPFAPFANLVRTAFLHDSALLEAVADLQPEEREFVLTLKGWDKDRIALVRQLPDVRHADPKELFRFATSVSGLTDPDHLQRFAVGLLSHYPKGIAAYEKHFGPLPVFERERIHALAAERRQDLVTAKGQWRSCVEQLTAAEARGDDALKTAMILRHMAELTIREGGPGASHAEVVQLLASSLELDPEDKQTYLKLMELARQGDDRKAQDQWIERAVRQFPTDAEVLMAAGLAAYRRRSFKKAAGFAQALLARDPINPHARNLLISCHLAHARKQMNAKRYPLAERELATAGDYAREDEQHGIVRLNQGFLALVQGSEQEAESLLRQGLYGLGRGLVAELRFLVEGGRLGIVQRTLTKHYNRVKEDRVPATPKEVVRLAEFLHRYLEDGVKELPQILDRLRAPLKAAAGLEFSEEELRVTLSALQKVGHHKLLVDYAGAALGRFGQQPRFLYYHIYGRTKGQAERLTAIEKIQLQSAMDRALKADDRATAILIEEFLGLPALLSDDFLSLPPAIEAVFEELMDLLNTDDPEEVLKFIEERMREEGELPPLPVPLPRGRPR
jgi:tetratricopeptide (TPR) repeat protein